MASHVVCGGLIYDSIKTKPGWLKWPVFVAMCYLFHWVLDSTPVYHDMGWPWEWWQWGIAFWNALAIILWLWQLDKPNPWNKWLRKVFAKRVLIGASAWLCVDVFWLYRPWGLWLHNVFPNMGRWSDPMSSVLELAFMAGLVVLGTSDFYKRRRRRKHVTSDRPSKDETSPASK